MDIPIQGFTGRLLYGSYPLANIVLGEAMTIRGNDTSTLVSQVNVNFLDLGQNIVQLVQSGEFLHGLRLKGTLRAFDFNVPINTPINIV